MVSPLIYQIYDLHLFKEITVRNVHNWQDTTIPLSDFISKSRSIATFAEEGGMLSVLYLPTSADLVQMVYRTGEVLWQRCTLS